MGHRPHLDLGRAHFEVVVGNGVEPDVTAQLGVVHREEGGRMKLEMASVRLPSSCSGANTSSRRAPGRSTRGEEGQTLDVVPVQMGDERRAPERPVVGLALPPDPNPGPEVQDDRIGPGRSSTTADVLPP